MIALFLVSATMGLAQLRTGDAAAAGMNPAQLEEASKILEAETASGRVLAASLVVARGQRVALHRGYGRMAPKEGSPAVTPETIFLLASITKPVTAAALMLLVERGRISIDDPVSMYLPEFTEDKRGQVRVRHLLSHTSGLPDMLPQNVALRRAHAPLSEFVKHAAATPLLYEPGRDFAYQSMGTLLAGEIVERLSGMRLRDFEQQEIFGPLGMKSSFLGMGGRKIEDTAWCQGGGDPADLERFGANSPYWRDMGHPWGGMHSTTGDLAILLQTFLNGGIYNGRRVWSQATVKQMIRDQNQAIGKPWGLGWGLKTSLVWCYFGDLVSPRTFGHSGATGTVAWADPETGLLCVILTTRPSSEDGGSLLRRVSNAVASAVLP